MYESYADTLESYIIDDVAEEGFGDSIKNKYNAIKNSKGGKAISSTAKGIGTAYMLYSSAKGIKDVIKNKISSSKAEEIERNIKSRLLSKYSLSGKFMLISDYSTDNSTICYLASRNNINSNCEERLHSLLNTLKKEYKFLKYRIGSTEEYKVLVKIYY